MEEGLYQRAYDKFIEILPSLSGMRFTSQDVWNLCGIQTKPEHAPFRQAMATLLYNLSTVNKKKTLKQTGRYYRVINRDIQPIRWMDADDEEYFELKFPTDHDYNTEFPFEHTVNISSGDIVVIGGVSNAGKSTVALNFLAENIDLHPCVLMGSEYVELDGEPDPRFKRRLKNIDWVEWTNNGESKFDLLPVDKDYEDAIVPNKINIIDWIDLTDNFFAIQQIIKDIKTGIGKGIAIIVLQKNEEKALAVGGVFSKNLAQFYFTIDYMGTESRLNVVKVKDKKGGHNIERRSWGFSIAGMGSRIQNIREVEKCRNCRGSGEIGKGQCMTCAGVGWVEIKYQEEMPFS